MNTHKVSSVLIMDAGRLAGIFTERDVLRRVVGANLDPAKVTMADVMSKGVTTVTRQTTIEEALEIFTGKVCRHLPVVDDGKVIGLISVGDISRWLSSMHRAEADQLKEYINGGFST
jgi:CBS domain-containing protein